MASDDFEGSRKSVWRGWGLSRPLENVSDQGIQGGDGGDFHGRGTMTVSEPLEYVVPWFLFRKTAGN